MQEAFCNPEPLFVGMVVVVFAWWLKWLLGGYFFYGISYHPKCLIFSIVISEWLEWLLFLFKEVFNIHTHTHAHDNEKSCKTM